MNKYLNATLFVWFMFNKKEIEELKNSVTEQLTALSHNINQRFEQTDSDMSQIKVRIDEVQENNTNAADKIIQQLNEINRLKSEFENALNRIKSVSRNIEETAAISVKDVAEKEIETIKAHSKKFRDLEDELKGTTLSVNQLQMELAKFVSISQQIKLVDFSLTKHQEEMSKSEKERMQLINDNERLKSMMAKMKRNR